MNGQNLTDLQRAALAAAEAVDWEGIEQENKRVWTVYDACAVIEGFDSEEHDEEEQLEAWQYLVDTGVVWQLQGFYGRGAKALIEAGLVELKGERK